MPLVLGTGVGYSPLLYRPRANWAAISQFLVGDVLQPTKRAREDPALVASYEQRIGSAFDALARTVAVGRLDALVVLYADRGDVFDSSNVPQIHVHVGGEVWGDPAIPQLAEPPRRSTFACERMVGEILAEELVRSGFDVSEGRELFAPLGQDGRGIGPAPCEAVCRLASTIPIVPLHVNCHVEPTMTGRRLHALGGALANALRHTDRRVGVLVTGGLSGDPRGPMAGWIDDVLDRWVLTRIERGQSDDLARVWDARSRTLRGTSAEIRLWGVAAAALEPVGCRARVVDYLPIHHAASGAAFVTWEQRSCP